MKEKGTEWRTVFSYAPMSNGRAERMVVTIKRSIGRLMYSAGNCWAELMGKAVFGYRRRATKDGHSPFYILYCVGPRLISCDEVDLHKVPSSVIRSVDVLAFVGE